MSENNNGLPGSELQLKTPEVSLPDRLPVLPLRDLVVFPFLMMPLHIGRPKSVKLVDESLVKDRLIALVTQRDGSVEDPAAEQLYSVGVAANIVRMLRMPDDTIRVLTRGICRVRIKNFIQTEPYFLADIERLHDKVQDGLEVKALQRNLSDQFQKLVGLVSTLPDEVQIVAARLEDPGQLADLVASSINIAIPDRQKVLEETDVRKRLTMVGGWLAKELEVVQLSSKIASEAHSEMTKAQREFYLHKQLEAIQKELGLEDPNAREISELRTKLTESGMPQEPRKEADRELDRLSKMNPSAAEYTVSRTYLDWLLEMPWKHLTADSTDLRKARRILDQDHYDLDKVKERILEYLGVRKLKPDTKGPILCFVGAPGVGKTSLGKSVARALGRKFVRVSLGGIRDEAEVRGHRRTYIGALPGRIIQGIRRAGSRNPVFMLDEVDKIGADFRGDPSSALLEVLDPEQNHSFEDHYLDVPFDLSKVMFITTANILDTIPPALLDRMEVLKLAGYTEEEKVRIARRHLIPKQLAENGLTRKLLTIHDSAIHRIIRDYTREAGLRNLEREIANLCRKTARAIAEGRRRKTPVTSANLPTLLGPVRFFSELKKREGQSGVATGLAWTQAGGAILFVEATVMKGKGGLLLTGQLGDVMKESAQAALSYVRTHAKALHISPDVFSKSDLHIHVPAGATPKDGPSAGIPMLASIVSALTQVPISPDVAMTGEITLSGTIIPVGGIKEKVLAAKSAGISTIILPRESINDLREIPPDIRKSLTFKPVSTIAQALRILFPPPATRPTRAATDRKPARPISTRAATDKKPIRPTSTHVAADRKPARRTRTSPAP